MALAFTPDGDRLIVSCLEHPPQLWDLNALTRPLSAIRRPVPAESDSSQNAETPGRQKHAEGS